MEGMIMDAVLALAIALAQPVTPEAKSPYTLACEQCQETGKPLAVFVGQPCQEWEGYVTVSVPELYGDATRRIVIARCGQSWPVFERELHPAGISLLPAAGARQVPWAGQPVRGALSASSC